MANTSKQQILTLHAKGGELYNAAAEQQQNIIGQRIAEARKRAEISLAKFSALLEEYGVTVTAAGINKWEVGKAVPNGNSGILCQFLTILLMKTSEQNAIINASQHSRGILYRFFFPEVNIGTRQIFAISAFVTDCNKCRIPRPGRGLFKYQCDIFPVKQISPDTCFAASFQLCRKLYKIEHFLICKGSQTEH
jgi:DNA-binding transcriptional regulator YiaG